MTNATLCLLPGTGLRTPRTAAPCCRGARGETEERTRDRVLHAVLEHGPVSAAELGELLGSHPPPSAGTSTPCPARA